MTCNVTNSKPVNRYFYLHSLVDTTGEVRKTNVLLTSHEHCTVKSTYFKALWRLVLEWLAHLYRYTGAGTKSISKQGEGHPLQVLNVARWVANADPRHGQDVPCLHSFLFEHSQF